MVDFQPYKNTLEQASLSQQTRSSEQPYQLDGMAHTGGTLNLKKKKSSIRSEHTRKLISGGPKSLGLPQMRSEEETSRSCFVVGGTMYARADDLPLTLEHLVGCRSLYPTKTALASMVWQVSCTSHFACLNIPTDVDSGRSMLPRQFGIRASICPAVIFFLA
jgi:hypothetical protein